MPNEYGQVQHQQLAIGSSKNGRKREVMEAMDNDNRPPPILFITFVDILDFESTFRETITPKTLKKKIILKSVLNHSFYLCIISKCKPYLLFPKMYKTILIIVF